MEVLALEDFTPIAIGAIVNPRLNESVGKGQWIISSVIG